MMKNFNPFWLTLLGSILIIHACRLGSTDECNAFKVTIVQLGTDQLEVNKENGLGPFSYEWSHGIGDFPKITVSESGLYSVTVTDHQNLCTSSASYNFTVSAGNGCGSFTAVQDSENNLYDIVTIGTQCWMQSNLSLEAGMQKLTNTQEWEAASGPAWCYYENDINNGPLFGKLYNRHAINKIKLCPDGWHIPTMADWEKLISHLGGYNEAGASLRKLDNLWSPGSPASNSSGFSALPGGRRQPGAATSFIGLGSYAGFWASQADSNLNNVIIILSNNQILKFNFPELNVGLSCRCVKN
ncbi:MAG: fibrobacter succinogenes major paralogous domain-containing protein [Saprospiraceae bacterium]|nr:fibrobacter succinogenes major paralogous domain-containing protein [Saprospiraceae bacterium]